MVQAALQDAFAIPGVIASIAASLTCQHYDLLHVSIMQDVNTQAQGKMKIKNGRNRSESTW